MRLLVLGLATLALSAGAASATGIATKRNLGSPRSTRGPRFMIRERSRMFVFQAWPRVVNNSRILVISGEDVALSPLNMRLAVADFAL